MMRSRRASWGDGNSLSSTASKNFWRKSASIDISSIRQPDGRAGCSSITLAPEGAEASQRAAVRAWRGKKRKAPREGRPSHNFTATGLIDAPSSAQLVDCQIRLNELLGFPSRIKRDDGHILSAKVADIMVRHPDQSDVEAKGVALYNVASLAGLPVELH